MKKFVFFPYNSPSLLSSGTLMDSLRMGTKILGPNVGSFKDLSYLSNVVVYDDFLEIPSIISQCNHTENDSEKDLEVFFEDNSWKKFAKNFFEAYCKITKKNKS